MQSVHNNACSYELIRPQNFVQERRQEPAYCSQSMQSADHCPYALYGHFCIYSLGIMAKRKRGVLHPGQGMKPQALPQWMYHLLPTRQQYDTSIPLMINS